MQTILQLKLTLRGSKPPIWRRVLVPSSMTFEQLHDVIQLAMGWTNSHLHEFTVDGLRIGPPLDEFDLDGGDELMDEATSTLESVLSQVNQPFSYSYDFGDSWEHAIVVEKRLTVEATTYPLCIGGKLNGPPEDCGGIPGFYHILRVLNDQLHPERRQMLDWLGGPYDPQAFDQQQVNRQLATLFQE